MGRIRVAGQLMLTILWLTIPTAARSPRNIFERDTQCPDPAYSQCANTGLPSNFCCPSGATCIPLAANTTLLCCPSGSDCSAIQPIPCDVSMQDANQHPDNILKTTALTGTLQKCGSQCCPFGFSCTGTTCTINTNQNVAPAADPSATSVSIIPTSSAKPTAAPNSASNTTDSPTCQKFPAPAVLAGFFPGLVAGIALALAVVCALGSRRKQDRRRSGSSFGNIGEPQLAGGDMRSDFLRKPPQTPSTIAGSSSTRSRSQRVRSLFRKSSSPTQRSPKPGIGMQENPRSGFPAPLVKGKSAQGQAQQRPVTPVLQREASYENINIFADGDTASSLREQQTPISAGGLAPPAPLGAEGRISHQTTFSDMMEHSGLAGLQKGQPYVYKGVTSPGYPPGPPRTREV